MNVKLLDKRESLLLGQGSFAEVRAVLIAPASSQR